MPTDPYNPLEKINLAQSIGTALLRCSAIGMNEIDPFNGAGVYAIYYSGDFAPYGPLREANADGKLERPIYVGKAIPAGGRKGGLTADASIGRSLFGRLTKHASSIRSANNLRIDDFSARYLIVDDIWIPLGENMLIETYQPLWNRVIDGFGNNDPGVRRATQFRSPWDVLHPGRPWAEKLADSPLTKPELEQRIEAYFRGAPVPEVDSRDDDQTNSDD